jgi:hypothetical protein
MLRFIIKRMVIRNQEAWDSLEEYIKTFDICNFPGENVSMACLQLKAVVTVLGDKLPSNAVGTLLEGFSCAFTKSFSSVCESKIAICSDSIYALLLKSVPLCNQVTSMLDDLEQKYQQLITAKKWEGIGHVGMNSTNKSSFNAMANQDDEEQGYAAYVKKTKSHKFLAFKEWAKLQKCNYCGNQEQVCPQCKKYLADKEKVLRPHRLTSITTSLSSTRTIIVSNSTRIQNSRPSSLHLQLSQMIISLSHSPSRIRKKMMTNKKLCQQQS